MHREMKELSMSNESLRIFEGLDDMCLILIDLGPVVSMKFVSENKVRGYLNKLSANKATGLDGIS